MFNSSRASAMVAYEGLFRLREWMHRAQHDELRLLCFQATGNGIGTYFYFIIHHNFSVLLRTSLFLFYR